MSSSVVIWFEGTFRDVTDLTPCREVRCRMAAAVVSSCPRPQLVATSGFEGVRSVEPKITTPLLSH